MFAHKKFRAALVASLMILFGSYGSGWAETGDFVAALTTIDWMEVAGPWLLAIGAQGVADIGKERAKVEARGRR